MKTAVGQIEAYSAAFRDLVNVKIRPTGIDIREALRLSKDEDWSFLCVSMDIIGDACTAIDSFLKFGLGGPTKYDDIGERYLRLYGILSATYIQQEALLKLYQLMNVPPSLREIKERLAGLLIRTLRHKLSSHSTNYHDKDTQSIQSYVPIRIDLQDFNCTYGMGGRGSQESVDLKVAIDEHLSVMIDLLDKILEKAIRTLFKGQETCEICLDFTERLKELRVEKDGGFVIQVSNGNKLIITLTPEEN